MNAEQLQEIVMNVLDDMKGRDIICLQVSDMTTITDFMVVVTGTSSRHVNSLADEVQKKVKAAGK